MRAATAKSGLPCSERGHGFRLRQGLFCDGPAEEHQFIRKLKVCFRLQAVAAVKFQFSLK